MYWAFTTMTTCGYGDIVPMNDIERMYAVFIMIMGATIFGYIVGTVGALAVNANGAPARRHARVSMATNYLEEQNMPKKWSDMVTKQLIFFFDVKSPFNEDGGLLAMMPRELRREIILQSHREIIPQIPLFKRQSRDFVSTVLTKMRPHCISKGQQILHSVDGSDGVYFLMKGTAAMHLLTPAREKVRQRERSASAARAKRAQKKDAVGAPRERSERKRRSWRRYLARCASEANASEGGRCVARASVVARAKGGARASLGRAHASEASARERAREHTTNEGGHWRASARERAR
jgi:hypothetical protein